MLVMTSDEREKLNELVAMEEQAKDGVRHIEVGANLLAIAVHRIYNEKLYLAHLDDTGLPMYPTQAAYEPHLLAELRISRATLYNHYTPIRVACGPTFKLGYDDFVNTGGKTAWGVVTKEFLDYDEDTAEARSLADGRPLEAEKLLEKLTEIAIPGPSELMLRPAQVRQELSEALGFEKDYQVPIRYYWDEGARLCGRTANNIHGVVLDSSGGYWQSLPKEIQVDILKRLGVR